MREEKNSLIKINFFVFLLLYFTGLGYSQINKNSIDFYPNSYCYCDSVNYYSPFPSHIGVSQRYLFQTSNDIADSLIKRIINGFDINSDTLIILSFSNLMSNDHFILLIQKSGFVKNIFSGVLKYKRKYFSKNLKVVLKEKKINYEFLTNSMYINRLLLNMCERKIIISDSEYKEIGGLKYLVFENKKVKYESEWFGFRN